jgi:hypothetical protein
MGDVETFVDEVLDDLGGETEEEDDEEKWDYQDEEEMQRAHKTKRAKRIATAQGAAAGVPADSTGKGT